MIVRVLMIVVVVRHRCKMTQTGAKVKRPQVTAPRSPAMVQTMEGFAP